MSKPIGMMSGVYFIGRGELLQWINDLLGLNYQKVEDTSNGAAFCQIIDCIHPGTVSMSKVNFNARTETESVMNYKVLQDAFDKNGIKQHIDVPTLVKGKYMAALELFQWMHGYFEQTGPHEGYDAAARRKQAKCRSPTSSRPVRIHTESTARTAPTCVRKAKVSAPARSSTSSRELSELRQRVQELEVENQSMCHARDFYYDKLRRIEEYCNDNEGTPNIQEILSILYETDESNGFISPQDDEEEDF